MILKQCCYVHTLRIAVGIMMLGLLLAGSANAANLTVCPGECAYSSIQEAINASSSGDTILVQSGTYLENVNVTRKLTLRGIGNPVVDAGGNGSAITLAVDGITLEGFTVIWGWDGDYYSSTSAGIKVTSSNNTLSGNNASNNYNGIRLSSSRNNTLKGNNVLNNDIGINLYSTRNNMMKGNNVSNNDIGIYLESSNNNKMKSNNVSSNNGNGISLYDSSNNTLSNNNVLNNYDAGIYFLYDSSNNKIYNNIFNNTNNLNFHDNKINTWNTTGQSRTNIIGGSLLGGNFWANPEGTGFSQTCPDVNGDGICDNNYIRDANNIDYLPISMNFTIDKIPPKSVNNLKNVSYASTYVNWTWKDPKDIDFKKVMVFIDGKFKGNVSKGKKYYNATNFTANTGHTISTRTVDRKGNINKTWTNSSAWTAK